MDMAKSTPMTRQTTMERQTPVDQGTGMRGGKKATMPEQTADMPVMTNGTSGQSQRTRDMKRTTPLDTDKSKLPTESTGEASRTPGSADTQAGNNPGDMNDTSKWDKSCFVSKTSSSFALQLKDGRVLHFDGASNEMIKSKLDSTKRVADKSKIFRARVKGDLNGDMIHVSDITM